MYGANLDDSPWLEGTVWRQRLKECIRTGCGVPGEDKAPQAAQSGQAFCALRPPTQRRGRHPGREGACARSQSPCGALTRLIPAVRCRASQGPCRAGPSAERVLGPGQPVSRARLSLRWPFPFLRNSYDFCLILCYYKHHVFSWKCKRYQHR